MLDLFGIAKNLSLNSGAPQQQLLTLGRLNNNKEGLAVTHDDLQRPVRVIPENTWEKIPGKTQVFSGFTRFFWHFLLADH